MTDNQVTSIIEAIKTLVKETDVERLSMGGVDSVT